MINHEFIEKNAGVMGIFIAIAISVGGLVEIVPLMYQAQTTQPSPGVIPYPPVELAGRDVYVSEGCYNCHSQMIRPFVSESLRYGPASLAGESVYDRPFQWGSKRTGPDLARVGGRYTDEWHRMHLINPRDLVPESNMPGFPWLEDNILDPDLIQTKMRVLQSMGHPYTDKEIEGAPAVVKGVTEMDAMIAYLQFLGLSNNGRDKKMSGLISGILTLFLLIMFLGIVVWAYSKRNKEAFEEMANLPLRAENQSQKGASDE